METTLILRTNDISSDSSLHYAASEFGCWSDRMRRLVFCVDLREVLGDDQYNETEIFDLELQKFVWSPSTWARTSRDTVRMQMSGLPFLKSVFTNTTKLTKSVYNMMSCSMHNRGGVDSRYALNSNAKFTKPRSPIVELTIDIMDNADDGKLEIKEGGLPRMQWELKIKRLHPEPKTCNCSTRIMTFL